MTTKRTTQLFLLCIVAIMVFTTCDSFNFNRETPSKNLEIASVTELSEELVSSSGGTINVQAPASAIDGMEIKVPANSYSSTKTFTISTADIENHNLGKHFNPITPLILIDNGGGYADNIIEITIPIEISTGEIPLGFYYNEISGTLESIPTKEYTSKSITLLTRHFMSESDFKAETSTEKSSPVPISSSSKLVVSSISESLINATPVISSGFMVGTDDWEFTNYGSYIAPGGHCAGQNMAAMWYYYEQKLNGKEQLFGRFSTHDNLWQDNAIGYRFCSVIHADLEWDGKVATFFENYIDKNQSIDKMKFYTIAGAMMLTGEPQGIGIYRQTGTYADGKPKYGGHDLICYQIAPNEGKLFISDPNKPGIGQTILLKDDKFEPYIAKQNGNAASNPYPFVTYYAKTAYIEWDKIAKRYTELLDSSIGYMSPNDFPDYQIFVKHKNENYEFWDGITVSNDTLRCVVDCPSAALFYSVDNKRYTGFAIYNEQGQIVSVSEAEWKKYTILKPGLNKLGFYIYGWRNGYMLQSDNTQYAPKFIDFKWFNVYNSKLSIEPNPVEADVNEEIEFEAIFEGQLPASVKYVWDFGDGKKKQTVLNDNTIVYEYSKEGEYEITLELYDNGKDQLIDQVSSQVTIVKMSDDLAKLKKSTFIDFDVSFDYYTNAPENEFGGGINYSWSKNSLVWSGNSFSVTYIHEDADDTGYKTKWVETVKGTVSADTKKLTTITFDGKRDYYYSNKWSNSQINKITLIDVPIVFAKDEFLWNWGTVDHFRYELEKEDIMSHVTDFTYGSYGLQWDSDIRDYVEYDWRWDKSHIVEFWDSFVVKFYETAPY